MSTLCQALNVDANGSSIRCLAKANEKIKGFHLCIHHAGLVKSGQHVNVVGKPEPLIQKHDVIQFRAGVSLFEGLIAIVEKVEDGIVHFLIGTPADEGQLRIYRGMIPEQAVAKAGHVPFEIEFPQPKPEADNIRQFPAPGAERKCPKCGVGTMHPSIIPTIVTCSVCDHSENAT